MFRPTLSAVRAALACGVLTACSGGGGPAAGPSAQRQGTVELARKDVADVIATVGDAPVGADDFRDEALRRPPADGKALSPEERKQVLDEVITQEVLFQEALQKGLYHDTKVRKILVNLLLRQEVYAAVDGQEFTDAELEAYYNDHKEEFVVPEKVQLKRILLRVSPERDDAATKALADEIYAEVTRDPRLFNEIASKRSEGPYARRGGDLGFISREGKPGVDPEVVEKAFTMKVEELLPPMKSGDAWQILYVTNRRERVERSFQQMRGSVLRMVKQERFKALTDTYIADARGRYDIKVDEGKVSSVDLARVSGRPELAPGLPDGDDHAHQGPDDVEPAQE
jgi:peptidyl-prolyl cis-trans isomerase C